MPDLKNVNPVPMVRWLLSQFRYKIHEANYVVR